MAKLYVLNISPKTDLLEGTDRPLRGAEIGLLSSAISAVAQKASIDQYQLCIDLRSQINDIADDATQLCDLTREDIDLLKKGFEATGSMQGAIRPDAWLYCGSIIEQLRNPIEQTD